ncbi:uncharacterized protein PV09_03051 [Verruconis gallopava]|uniref:Heterokaryon incompatibility domain-containing protein n=1 Tax=Verruconis gallopava TaxID=253628 RepID=A0A0D2AFU9_9PEZI|nr:uncharacterized protein PV09_03051 [Verruconis gallopava]KIW05848.1 hypothetical protein PV09_03051 [Verruconis gallopava]
MSDNTVGQQSSSQPRRIPKLNLSKETTVEELEKYVNALRLQDTETGPPDPAAEPPNWLEEDVGASSLWAPAKDYASCKFCLNCFLTVSMLATDYNRRGPPETFKWKHLREVNTFYHIDPSRMGNDYTPKDIMESAIEGCPMCALAVGTSWFRGDVPFDTARWMKNPLWRKRAQYLLIDHYASNHWVPIGRGSEEIPRPLLEIVYGTKLTTEMYPEADMSEFWGSIHFWDNEELQRWYQRYACPYTLKDTLGKPPLGPLCPNTGDGGALGLAIWWFKRCLGEHKSCASAKSQSSDDSQYPSRLLYLGTGDEPLQARLVISEQDLSDRPEFVTLSYCWGKKPFMKLTQDVLEQFRKNIDFESLPKTFKDAILVTRLLDHSYIWIDALCIIQDSKEDWRNESAKMGSIYRHSVLTIAALGASDSSQGCFTARHPCVYGDIPLSSGKITITSRTSSHHGQPQFRREFEVEGKAASPLKTRGWCVQEELLSPRTLYFGSSGIFWQCIECEADEGYPVGTRGQQENLKSALFRTISSGQFNLSHWRIILERYTRCKLTYPSDKIVAISGVANLLGRAAGEEFVEGMWKRDIWRELLWHSRDIRWADNHTCHRLENDHPSFSWASVGQAITFFRYDYPNQTSIAAPSVSIVEDVQTSGTAIKHKLHIRSQLREVILLPPAYSKTGQPTLMLAHDMPFPEPPTWVDPEVPNAVIIRLQKPVRLDHNIDRKTDQDIDTSHLRGFAYDWIPDIPLDGSITRAYFIPVAKRGVTDPAGSIGLVAIPVDEERKEWKRIGFLFHGGFPDSWKTPTLRVTVQNTETGEVDWEETAKMRAPNPFLLNPEEDYVDIVLR